MLQKVGKHAKWLVGGDSFIFGAGMDFLGRSAEIRQNGIVETAARSLVAGAIYTALGPFGMPIMMGSSLATVGAEVGKAYNRAKLDSGRTYQTTMFNREAAYTMRQRAIQAIQGSHLNARSALGNEASLMHR